MHKHLQHSNPSNPVILKYKIVLEITVYLLPTFLAAIRKITTVFHNCYNFLVQYNDFKKNL